jgi:hypothetical protein
MTELDAERIGVALVSRLLPLVIGGDPVAREDQRVERAKIARFGRSIDFGVGDAKAKPGEIDAIELAGQLDQGAVAVATDVGNNRANSLIDVVGDLTFGRKKSGKACGKVRGSAVEANRHRALSGREEPGFTGQWPAPGGASTLFDRRLERHRGGFGDLTIEGMLRAALRLPNRPKIGQLGLKALDFQAERRAARKHQSDDAGGLVGLLERHREQVQHLVFFHGRAVAAFAG